MIERREALLSELFTLRDYIRWGASRFNEAGLFFGHGTDNAWDEAVQLVMHVLHLPLDSDPDLLNARLCMDERRAVLAMFERRIQDRTPAAHLIGEAHFAGLVFTVNEHVLVPRSPIAELIENEFQPWLEHEPQMILDLCTGSGCIGIATASVFPYACVDLSDISAEAIAVANANIDRYDLSERVRAVESDLFAGLKGQRYDLIVSNPPYVDAEDLEAMPEEYKNEPEIALGSGFDGLDFTRKLLMQAQDYLTDNGVLIVELGNSWVHMEDVYPSVPFTWLEFERGGHGVFMLTAGQLKMHQAEFAAACA